jgi:hypothetical protein
MERIITKEEEEAASLAFGRNNYLGTISLSKAKAILNIIIME